MAIRTSTIPRIGRSIFDELKRLLLDPHPVVAEPSEKYMARAVTIISLLNLLGGITNAPIVFLQSGPFMPVFVVGVTLFAVAYVLTRTRYWTNAKWVTFAGLVVMQVVSYLYVSIMNQGFVFANWTPESRMHEILTWQSLLAIPVVCAVALFPNRYKLPVVLAIASISLVTPIATASGLDRELRVSSAINAMLIVLLIYGGDFLNRKVHESDQEALKQLNRNLQIALDKAQEANRLKSEFVATMSHELRTPLHAIIGYADVQLAGMAGPLPNEIKGYQERILVNAEHLLQLIDDVLDISKIEAGRMEITRKPFRMETVVQEIMAETESLAARKGLAYGLTIDSSFPQQLVGDPEHITQIATNLISNAIKFTEKGEVRVNIRLQRDDHWSLSVRDTGQGIPREAQEYIFDEFRQVDGTHSRKHGGTGLGLAIVKKLVALMGGKIDLKSEIDVGSTFTVLLPLIPEDMSLVRASAPQKEWQNVIAR